MTCSSPFESLPTRLHRYLWRAFCKETKKIRVEQVLTGLALFMAPLLVQGSVAFQLFVLFLGSYFGRYSIPVGLLLARAWVVGFEVKKRKEVNRNVKQVKECLSCGLRLTSPSVFVVTALKAGAEFLSASSFDHVPASVFLSLISILIKVPKVT